uniref:Uncharacterized protein n=1 Tax=Opuntia streptacantha TaxID=393608 RepID=A0A7C9A998_OPUST
MAWPPWMRLYLSPYHIAHFKPSTQDIHCSISKIYTDIAPPGSLQITVSPQPRLIINAIHMHVLSVTNSNAPISTIYSIKLSSRTQILLLLNSIIAIIAGNCFRVYYSVMNISTLSILNPKLNFNITI